MLLSIYNKDSKSQYECSTEKLVGVNYRARTSNSSGFILIPSLLVIIPTYSVWLIENLPYPLRSGFPKRFNSALIETIFFDFIVLK